MQKIPLGEKHKMLVAVRPSDVEGIDQGSIHVLNNTIYLGRDFGNSFTICTHGGLGSQHVCMNNLVCAPGMQRKLGATQGPGWAEGGNLLQTGDNSPFVSSPPKHLKATLPNLDGFRLAQSSAAVGAGYDFAVDAKSTGDAVPSTCSADAPPLAAH